METSQRGRSTVTTRAARREDSSQLGRMDVDVNNSAVVAQRTDDGNSDVPSGVGSASPSTQARIVAWSDEVPGNRWIGSGIQAS